MFIPHTDRLSLKAIHGSRTLQELILLDHQLIQYQLTDHLLMGTFRGPTSDAKAKMSAHPTNPVFEIQEALSESDTASVVVVAAVPSMRLTARVILCAEPTPFSAMRAVDSLQAHLVDATVLVTEPTLVSFARSVVLRGDAFISNGVRQLARNMPVLSSRQVQILELVAAGYTNKRIAKELILSEASLKRAIADLSRSLEVYGRSQLIAFALALGFAPYSLEGRLTARDMQAGRSGALSTSTHVGPALRV